MPTYNTPGVYIEEVSLLPPSVAAVPTAIPVFIGYTGNPLNLNLNYDNDVLEQPIKISSFREYEEYFGKPQKENANFEVNMTVAVDDTLPTDPDKVASRQITGISLDLAAGQNPSNHIMNYALQFFYQNGGGDCYVISVGNYDDTPGISLGDGSTTPGLWKGLNIARDVDEITLIVCPEAVYLSSPDDYFSFHQQALKQSADLQDRFDLIDVRRSGNSFDINADKTAFRGGNISITDKHLQYGGAYYPYLDTTIDYYFGNAAADEFEDVAVALQVVDQNGAAVVVAGLSGSDIGDLKSSLNDMYQAAVQLLTSKPVPLPPSPGIAGIYNLVDTERGVWKAPANVRMAGVIKPGITINDQAQGNLNIDPDTGKSINAIRPVPGRGIAVWGARTLDGNDNEFRYIAVRRFFNFVEESVKKATYQFVFEPNDANTWNTVRAMIENFLTIQWNQGALQGAKADQAFFVRVGLGQTMTQQDILEGRMIVEIGMAVVRPAEFIILRFMHKLPEA